MDHHDALRRLIASNEGRLKELELLDEQLRHAGDDERLIARRGTLDIEYEETRQRIDELLAVAEQNREGDRQREKFGPMLGTVPASDDFAGSLLKAGFNPLEGRHSVVLQAAVTPPAASQWKQPERFISPLGMDERFMFPSLRQSPAGENSAVVDFRQTARSTTGTVQRAIDAVTDKAEQAATLTAVTEQLVQWAVVISDIPNQLLQSVESLADFVADEGRYRIGQAIDAHVLAQIVAATPPFGQTGADLIAQIRNGVGSMRAVGANPTLLVVNPTDSATLDLSTSGTSTPYIFPMRDTGAASPLFGLKVIERAGSDPKYLIDPEMLGVLYVGDVKVEADPFSGFKANTTRIRVETHGLFHVRQIEGARRVAAT